MTTPATKIVPVEPTEEMARTGACHITKTDHQNDRYYSAKEVYKAMLAAAPAQPQGWLPIESAPKDGQCIMLYEPPGYIGTAYWGPDNLGNERWIAGKTKNAKSGAFMQMTMSIDEPTHWMPLPPPPERSKE